MNHPKDKFAELRERAEKLFGAVRHPYSVRLHLPFDL